jgi:ketosteroid isomerase-like protein
MRRVVSTVSLALLAVAVLGATGGTPQAPSMPPQPSVTLPPDLARVLTDYEAAWSARDAAALARLFADNRVVVPNACPPVKGRAAVQQCYTGSGGALSLRAVAFGTDGSLGYIIGAYTQQKDQPDGGKFTLTLLKEEGRWLILADMDRSYLRPQ